MGSSRRRINVWPKFFRMSHESFFEPKLGALLLIGDHFEKEIGNLFEQLLFRDEGGISVLVSHLRLSGKSLHKVLLGPGPGIIFSFICLSTVSLYN